MFKFVIAKDGTIYVGKARGSHGYHMDICGHLPSELVAGAGYLRYNSDTEWECYGRSEGYWIGFTPEQEERVVAKIQHLNPEDMVELIYKAYEDRKFGVTFCG